MTDRPVPTAASVTDGFGTAARWTRRHAPAAVLVAAFVGVVGTAHVLVAPAGHRQPTLLGVLVGLWGLATLLALGGAYASIVGDRASGPRVALEILPEDERRLVERVLDAPGITQAEVVDRSDHSAAKVSQTLTSLRERGLVYREPQGRTFRLYPGSLLDGAADGR